MNRASKAAIDPKALVPRDASTVMIVRDAISGTTGGVEVVMVRRTTKAAFAAGAWVFPGGAVDDSDQPAAESFTRGRTQSDAAAAVGSERGLGVWFAAVREAFEEVGLLLGAGVLVEDPAAARRAVNAGEVAFGDLLGNMGATIDIASIAYVDRWVTPKGESRRFDTRFFLALSTCGQEPIQDENEVTEVCWVRPGDVLDRNKAGEAFLLPPTIVQLQRLERAVTAQAALDEGLARTGIKPVKPELLHRPDGAIVLRVGTGDAGDPECEIVLRAGT